MERVSLKRRRSRVEVGIAGCCLLASPAQAVWSFGGTVWPFLQPSDDHRVLRPQQHHGTGLLLRGDATTDANTAASPPGALSLAHPALSPRSGSDRLRRIALASSRGLEVEALLHAAVGEWEECSPSTCTQTRTVVCETRDDKIVPGHLCGDEMPETERACVDALDSCSSPLTEEEARAEAAAGEATAPGASDGGGRKKDSVEGQGSGAATLAASDADAEQGAASGDTSAGSSPPSAADARQGTPEVTVKEKTSSRGWPRQGGRETGGGGREGGGGGGGATEARGGDNAAGKGGGEGLEGRDSGGGVDGNGGAAAVGRGGGRERVADSKSASPSAEAAAAETGAQESKLRDPNLVEQQQGMERVGGAPGPTQAEERFWIVLAIGAGAVGSFLAVVVFAVGQYRKEQHRMRGIMALNEFPQDNYINPFASQLSEDDRSAFNL